MQCLSEQFTSLVIAGSFRRPCRFLSRSYCAAHGNMELCYTTHNSLTPKSSAKRGFDIA